MRVFVAWVAAFSLIGLACGEDKGDGGPKYEPLPAELADAFDAQRAAFGAPGVAVAVMRGGEIVYAQGIGSKHPAEDQPFDANTLFRMGSINKMMTATAVLQAVQDGTLSLDDLLIDHLGPWEIAATPEWSQQVTIEHLLTHQGAFVDALTGTSTLDAGLETWVRQTLTTYYQMAPPGTFYNYSNPNFMVAGLMTELADGERYYNDIMREDVWDPLGMTRTVLKPADVIADGNFARATSASFPGQVVEPDTFDNAAGRPAGFAWTSVVELAHFMDFLLHGNPDVLDDSLRAELMAEHVNTQELLDYYHYGYGVSILRVFPGTEEVYDTPLVSHNGAIPGFSAGAYSLPEHDIIVTVLSNGEGAYYDASMAKVVETLVADELGAPLGPIDFGVDPADFPAFDGTYSDPFNVGDITVTANGNVLDVDAPKLDQNGVTYSATMTPVSKNNFVWTADGFQFLITFIDAPDGTTYMRARYFVAVRAPAIPPAASVTPDVEGFLMRLRSEPPAPPAWRRLVH